MTKARATELTKLRAERHEVLRKIRAAGGHVKAPPQLIAQLAGLIRKEIKLKDGIDCEACQPYETVGGIGPASWAIKRKRGGH